MDVDQYMDDSETVHSTRLGILFGVAIFACMLVWSQLVPLGAAPDEPSNFIKSAAIIRGQFIGKDMERWLLTVDGWALDNKSGIRRILVVVDGHVAGEGVPSAVRRDVAEFFSIDPDTLVGFSINIRLPNDDRRTYAVYAELNDGTLVILPTSTTDNVVTSPSQSTSLDGRLPRESSTTFGYVDQSRVSANLSLSYWSTEVAIDPQFGAALPIAQCFAFVAANPGCNTPIEDQTIIDDPPWTGMGRYPPAGFAISGIGTLAGPNDFAFRLSRAMTAGVSAFLLTLAFICVKRRSLSVLPMLIAITPGVIFNSSVISPSGLEICAAVALWVSLSNYVTDSEVHRLEAVTVALSGVLLIAVRPLGVLLYAAVAGTVLMASGLNRSVVAHVRRHRVVYGLHSLSALFMIWWYLFIFNPAVDPRMTEDLPKISLGAQLLHAIGDIPRVIEESIGNFGWLDSPTPRPLARVILGTTVTMVVVGWRSLAQSAKRALVLLGAACVVLIIAVDLNFYEILRGFGVQGRHITPLLVGIPIVGARYLRVQNRTKWVVVGIWCGVVVGSGLAALRRYAVGVDGDNALDMFSHPVWSPPFGINLSIALLILTSIGVGAVVILTQRAQRT
ncbi:MAG: DUF2142 domain-containing protein [Ilumatobacteraceae bacterium]